MNEQTKRSGAHRRLARTVFVSMPDTIPMRTYYAEYLVPTARKWKYKNLAFDSYLNIQHGRWLEQIEHKMLACNAVLAILVDNNPNVILEVGRALALGKPLILLCQEMYNLPSMLRSEQAIWFAGPSPTEDSIDRIVSAIEVAVFSILQRERSDARTRIQKRCLLGSTEFRQRPRPHQHATQDDDLHARRREVHKEYGSGQFLSAAAAAEACARLGDTTEEILHLCADAWFLAGETASDDLTARSYYENLLSSAEKGLKLCPQSYLLRKDRGLGLMKLGQLDGAHAAFEELMRLKDTPIAHYNMACVCALMGKRLEMLGPLSRAIAAEEYYRELARVDSDFETVWDDKLFQALVFDSGRA